MTAREMVWDLLSEVNEQGALSHVAYAEALEKYNPGAEERAFATRLFHGTLERQQTIDRVLEIQAKRPVGKIKARVRELLRLSAYQLLFLTGVPASAACNEAVSMAKRRGLTGLSGFVNGVLRGIARAVENAGGAREYVIGLAREMSPTESLCFRYSVPEWMVELWQREYPKVDLETMLAAYVAESPLSVRLNKSRAEMPELIESLTAEGADPLPGILPNVLRLTEGGNPSRYTAYGKGWFSVQDESAVLAGNLLPLAAGMHVLDLCAAPGGKTVHAADELAVLDREAAEDKEIKLVSSVEARDIKEEKIAKIREQAERVGLSNVTCRAFDASEYDETLDGWADVVIADVPCSGLGVIGRKPDIKTKTKPEDIEALANVQRSILRRAVKYLRPGGYLAYSTCTVARAENADMAAFIISELGLTPVDLREKLPAVLRSSELQKSGTTAEGIQIFPEAGRWDGFFIAGFRKPQE